MSYNVVVYKRKSSTGVLRVHAQKNDGTMLSDQPSAPDADTTAIRVAVKQAGDIYIEKGSYTIMAGVDIPSNTRIVVDAATYFAVPSGYAGHVWHIGDGVRNVEIHGGHYWENTPQRRWTAVLMHSSTGTGVFNNEVHNISVYSCNVAVKLLVDGDAGWINGNTVRNCFFYGANVFIDFDMRVPFKKHLNGFNRNHFSTIACQPYAGTTHGARNIGHIGNFFDDVKFWDLQITTGSSATISEDAYDTIILGGIMTNQNFIDAGVRTKIIDPFQDVKLSGIQADNIVCGSEVLPANATTGFLYIPMMNGAPTGVPKAQNGTVAMVWDSVNNRLCVYENGAWKYLQ